MIDSFEYKTGVKPNQFTGLYQNNDDKSNISDPPVERASSDSFNIYEFKKFIEESISDAKEFYCKNDLYELSKNIDLWRKHINELVKLISKPFLHETDLCLFLIQMACQGNDSQVQKQSILLIADLTRLSKEAIDEFIDSNGIRLFIDISNSQLLTLKLTGYMILGYCLNTQKGLKAFISNNVVGKLNDTFRQFLSLPNLSQDSRLKCVCAIADVFDKFLDHIEDKDIGQFPQKAPEEILSGFLRALNVNYNMFFQYALHSAIKIVKHMKDEGNKIILKTGILDRMKDEFNSGSEEKIYLIINLLRMIFTQVNQDLKIQLIQKIPQEFLINSFLTFKIDSDIFISLTNTICNCFMCGMSCKWITNSDYIAKFYEIFETGNYESKRAATKCLIMATYFSSTETSKDQYRKILNSNLLIPAVQFILSLNNNNDVINILKIINQLLEKIIRFGIKHPPDLNNKIIDVLRYLIEDSDESVSHLADYLLKNYFPEAYFED